MLKIYNTLSKAKEKFIPGMEIIIYTCGITVYDHCHIGHARSFIFFDSFVRYLNFLGYKVIFIRNITDIDDKILNIAYKKKTSFKNITKKFIKNMHIDISKLNLIEATFEPKATTFINNMLDLIKILNEKGYAYVNSSKDVCFCVRKVTNYGILSNRHLKFNNEFNILGNKDNKTNKNNKEDFVLWKSDNSFRKWKSFYGYGRPGWHTECAAMSVYYSNSCIDIHSGGVDLVFPHHENELAQTTSFCEKNIVKFWLHLGQLKFQKKKMSKSLNNFILIKNFLNLYNEEYLRFFLLLTHYKKSINYSDEILIKTNKSLDNLYKILLNLKNNECKLDEFFKLKFLNCMNDDLNTSKAISVFFEILKKIKKETNINSIESQNLLYTIKALGNIIGLFKYEPKIFLDKQFDIPKKILNLVKKRNIARRNADWVLADGIRNDILKLGFRLNDNSSFTSIDFIK
ncbi:MAG TPA: cysteine--tRNA ligase [Candidatus Azoamicus sp.]